MQGFLDWFRFIARTAHRLVDLFPVTLLALPVAVMDHLTFATAHELYSAIVTDQHLSTTTALPSRVNIVPHQVGGITRHPIFIESVVDPSLEQVRAQLVLEFRLRMQYLLEQSARLAVLHTLRVWV